MNSLKASILPLAASVLVLSSFASRSAGDSVAFLNGVWSNVSFLDQSSRLALVRSKNASLRKFAHHQAADQTAVSNALAAYSAGDGAVGSRDIASQDPAKGSLVAMPFRAAANLSAGVADAIDGLPVRTGRSAAVDSHPAHPEINLRDIKIASLDENLKRLTALSGAEFDAFYRECQIDALLQLSTAYASYIQTGGDPALRALATRSLPVINNELSIIKTLR